MDINEISTEIKRLERSDTTYSNCEKLSTLYTVRNGLKKDFDVISGYSYASEPASEFLRVAGGAPIDGVLSVIDDHMEEIKMLFPKEYNAIIDRIRMLRS